MDTTCKALRASQKFNHPDWTATGEPRAHVALTKLQTLWFNTGTLCNDPIELMYFYQKGLCTGSESESRGHRPRIC